MKCYLTFLYVLLQVITCAQTLSRDKLIQEARKSVVWIHSFGWPTEIGMGKYSFGTGFVVNGDLIITNHHVVKNATGLIIYDSAKEENSFIAYPVWSDSVLDLAILRTVDKLTLPSLTLANQWDLKLGEDILVIGFPGETYKPGSIKVTRGIISSTPEDSTIQIDAAINFGNSGGPCINMDGKVVGVVFSKMAGYGIEGMGFLRNVDFVRKGINRAPSLSQIDFKKTLGTSSLKAYKNLCLGQQKMWLSKMTDNNATRRLQIEGAKKLLFESIDEDARYADAHYFLAAFFFEEALTFCFDGQDYSANASAANFEKEVEKAISIKPSLQYNAATKSMKNYAANGKIKCTELRTIVLANRTTQINKLERIIEFNEYLESGEAPKVLQKTLRYGSAEYEHRSERTEGNTNNSSHEKLNPFMQVMERVNPSLAFTSVYLAKPLFKDGLDISFKNFDFAINVYNGIYINAGTFISRKNENYTYLGGIVKTLFGKFLLQKSDSSLHIPLWNVGFVSSNRDNCWKFSAGQMNLLKEVKKTTLIFGSLKEYSAVELKKTFFAKLDADFLITTPVWVNFLINYPLISNGSEYYQVGAGITVRFFPI